MEERNEESPLGEVKEGTQKVEGKPEGKNGEKTSKEDSDEY